MKAKIDFSTEIVHGHYLVSLSSTGAMSLFSPAEYLAFNYIIHAPQEDHPALLRRVLSDFGCSEEKIAGFTDIFLKKLRQQGWFRDGVHDPESQRLQMVYFSITTKCNLSCAYCYIGDERRNPDHLMTIDDARIILKKIWEFNPLARIAVTGGEPFTHPAVFQILDILNEYGLKFSLGTNAVLVDRSCAERLKGYGTLLFVQASLDGMTPEVHSLTRGNTWQEAMNGIRNLIEQKVPFAIAPTLHEGNLHEIYDIARFAYSHGGFFAPNHLRKFPHAPHAGDIYLKPESLRKCIIETFEKTGQEFNLDVQPAGLTDKGCEELHDTRGKFVCGNAFYTVDIDWNGDVYPCHLLREACFIIGNILAEDFNAILERGRNSKTRVRSFEIPKCKSCPFVATCAGGCRASAFYTRGTLAAEDEFCDILYKFEVDKLFLHKPNPQLRQTLKPT